MKIATKTVSWKHSGIGAVGCRVYVKQVDPANVPAQPFSYEDPSVFVPGAEGQTDYSLTIPGQLPIGEGTYAIGIAAVDAEGNAADIVVLIRFFDFTAPDAIYGIEVK